MKTLYYNIIQNHQRKLVAYSEDFLSIDDLSTNVYIVELKLNVNPTQD